MAGSDYIGWPRLKMNVCVYVQHTYMCVCVCVCHSLLVAHKAVRSTTSAEVHQGRRGMGRLVALGQSVHTQTPGLLW